MAPKHDNQNQDMKVRFEAVQHKSVMDRLKTAATCGAIGLVAFAGYKVYDAVEDIDLWPFDAPQIDMSGPKEAADDAMSAITRRRVQPLKINPEDVVRGEVTGMQSFGKAERPVTVLKASKKYDGFWPGTDEWINLYDGEYMSESFVTGNATVKMDTANKRLTVILDQPATNDDIRTVREARHDDDPQWANEIGQLPGDNTDSQPARDELQQFLLNEQRNDDELHQAAACAAVETTGRTVRDVLAVNGFRVLMGDEKPSQLEVSQNPGYAVNALNVDVIVPIRPDDEIAGPRVLDWEACRLIVANTMDADSTVSTLSGRQIEQVKLETE